MYMYVCVCCIGAVLGQFDATEARCVSMEGRYIHVYTYMYTVYSVYNSVLESEIKTCTWTNVHVHCTCMHSTVLQ